MLSKQNLIQRAERLGVDASRITNLIYQGGKPPVGTAVAEAGFNVLVLAAEEYQPTSDEFPGVDFVIHAGIDDNRIGPTDRELEIVRRASKVVARSVELGQRVLVTCQMGFNRSGFITAMALLRLVRGTRGRDVVDYIHRKRPGSLFNAQFVKHILRAAP